MAKKRVVITGACGYVVQRNWEELVMQVQEIQ